MVSKIIIFNTLRQQYEVNFIIFSYFRNHRQGTRRQGQSQAGFSSLRVPCLWLPPPIVAPPPARPLPVICPRLRGPCLIIGAQWPLPISQCPFAIAPLAVTHAPVGLPFLILKVMIFQVFYSLYFFIL